MKVIKINPGQFSKDGLRAGDLIALGNFLEYIRVQMGDINIKMFIPAESIRDNHHIHVMHRYLLHYTDYFASLPYEHDEIVNVHTHPGTDETYPDLINLWNIRKDVLYQKQNVIHIPDAVKIDNAHLPQKKKIVIAPLMDADYNKDRNWTSAMLQKIIVQNDLPEGYTEGMVIAAKEAIPDINVRNFTYCFNYRKNLDHIAECTTYIGGDTGLSHFAGAQTRKAKILEYYYPTTTYGTTNPFNWKTVGTVHYYNK